MRWCVRCAHRTLCRGYATQLASSKKYTETLQLPKTTFSLRPNHNETAGADVWVDLYHWQRARKDTSVEEYIIHDGPPYANGNLHIGHALNKILKDVIVRRKILDGRKVRYVPGWDCHGLPIELKALQAHEADKSIEDALTSGHEKSPAKIRAIARSLAERTIRIQSEQFQRMAICADWKSPYITMSLEYELEQLKVFSHMVDSGLVYRAEKPVYWSPSSRTALAEAELEYKDDHVSTSVYVAYPVCSNSISELNFPHGENLHLLIWTTTPWTLPANRAIAINAALDYTVITSDSRHYIVAASLVDKISKLLGGDQIKTSEVKIKGKDLLQLLYKDVLGPDIRPILAAPYVSAESGTGLVHTAPGHGQDDYLLCRNLEVPILPFSPVDATGCYTASVKIDSLVGLDVQGAGTRRVIELLREQGNLVALEKYKHKYPYDWRTKRPVLVRSTPQFFADLSSIKSKSLDAIEDVAMLPSSGKAKLHSYVKGRDEWCISRQRSWGVPIPALYNSAGDVRLNQGSISHILSVLQKKGMEAWFEEDTDIDSWQQWVEPSMLDDQVWTRGKETLDVWFDSGCSWTTLASEEKSQINSIAPVADLYLEGSDQHRGWFQSSLLTSVATRGYAPYKNVITHGFVLDDKGRKMSKSIGNVLDPLLIIGGRPGSIPVAVDATITDKKSRKQLERLAKAEATEIKALGADTLRLWVAQSDFTSDVHVSTAILSHVSESLRKYRTTLRYLLGNLHDFDAAAEIEPSELHAIDRYAIARSTKFRSESELHYEKYSFKKVVASLNHYTNAHLSAFYLDTLKDRLYADHKHSHSRKSAQTALYRILKDYMLVLAPICPEIVYEMWHHLPTSIRQRSGDNIYVSQWHTGSLADGELNADLLQKWSDLLQLRQKVNKELELARASKLIGSSLQASLTIQLPEDYLLPVSEADLANIFVVSHTEVIRSSDTGLHVTISQAPGEKCPRCWMQTAPASEELCERCETVMQSPHSA